MDPTILQALSDWAASKNCGIGLTAINSLISVDAVREFLHERRTLTGIFAEEPIVDEREWLKFYGSLKTLEQRLLKGLFDDRASEFAAVMDALRNPRGADEPSRLAALGLILGCFSKLESATWSELLPAILDDDPLEDLEPEETDNSEDAAVSFYFWVHLPCWFVYGKTPTKLIRELSASGIQAEKAAEYLVRMDRRIANHPKLLRWINSDARIAAFRREKVRKWIGRAPFDKEKSSSLALRITAGYVSRASDLLDERIKSPELRSLIETLGNQVPSDLQDYLLHRTTDDWSREIRRYREHLVEVAKPDKSAYESVRALLKKRM